LRQITLISEPRDATDGKVATDNPVPNDATDGRKASVPRNPQEDIADLEVIEAKIVNMSPERLDIRWNNNGTIDTSLGTTDPFQSWGVCTKPGHVLCFGIPDTSEIVCTFKIEQKVSMYYFDPFNFNNPSDPSAGVHSRPVRSQKELRDDQLELYVAAVRVRNSTASDPQKDPQPSRD